MASMTKRAALRTRLILLGVAVATAAIMLSWDFFVVRAERDCLRERGIWDEPTHSCAHPVSIAPDLAPAKR